MSPPRRRKTTNRNSAAATDLLHESAPPLTPDDADTLSAAAMGSVVRLIADEDDCTSLEANVITYYCFTSVVVLGNRTNNRATHIYVLETYVSDSTSGHETHNA